MMIFNILSYILIMSITPGPNNIICLSLGSRHGYKTAAKYITGVVVGCLTMQWLLLILNQVIAAYLPTVTTYVAYVGAIYILYLAYKIIVAPLQTTDENTNTSVLGFKEGILLQYVNPKAYIYNTTIITAFLIPMHLNLFGYIIFAIASSAVGFMCCSTWALFGNLFREIFRKYGRQLNIAMGLMLVYLAVTIVIH